MIDFRGLIQGLQRENFNLYQFLSGMLDRFDKFVLDFSALSSETFVNSDFFKDTSTVAWDFSIPDQVSANVPDKSITYFKIQDVTAGNVLGRRSTNGEIQEVLVANSIVLAAGPALVREALTGDVTATRDSNATTIANDAVTYAKMQNASVESILLGRGQGGGVGDLQEITLGANLSMVGLILSAAGGSGTFLQAAVDFGVSSPTPSAVTVSIADLGVGAGSKIIVSTQVGIGRDADEAELGPVIAYVSAINPGVGVDITAVAIDETADGTYLVNYTRG